MALQAMQTTLTLWFRDIMADDTQDKLVKTLLKGNWRPKSALVFGCTRQVKIKTYLDELDLVMYYDTDTSPFLRNIEKI